MKVIISYPPFPGIQGTPLLSQNRQYQVFSERTVIYPVVPAQAATLLKQAGHEVIWNDCIAQGWNYKQFLDFVKQERPHLVAFETKTPVVKQHWKIISDLKELFPIQYPLFTVLCGDHVTALPQESMQNSKVDYILTGGDYDFLLLNLCNYLSANTAQLEPGIWYRENGQVRNTGRFQLDHDLDTLPFIDRGLTQWQLYAYENGNYKRTPGTYIMCGRDCWHRERGGCAFCSWTTLYPRFRVRSTGNVLDEIGELIEKYNVKEIMDDCGSLPAEEWLRTFSRGMIERGYHKKVHLDCNFRFGAASFDDYKLMKKAGFRLLLFGLESANQVTLDRVNKNITPGEIIDSCKLARKAGLFPHITIMFGYPWETYKDALKTLKLGRWLLKKGYAYTVQATIVIPYPGTPLFEECKEQGVLKTLDWDKYDMKQPIMKTPIPDAQIKKLVRGIYSVAFNPEFIYHRLSSVKDIDDIKYFLRAGKKVLGHLFDFRHK